jgi:hypothetical protein
MVTNTADRRRYALGILPALLLSGLLVGCATQPTEIPEQQETIPFNLGRIRTISEDDVTVSLAVPTESDVSTLFGVPLAVNGIQPIWMRIENDSAYMYWILPISIDPDYYTADEAAQVTSDGLSDEQLAAVTARFRQNALPFVLAPGSVNEGYVYATHRRGGRFVDIRIPAFGHEIRMRFAVLLPTQGFDYEESLLRQLYAQVGTYPSLTIEQTRERIRELPCCTTNEAGTGQGDPLNIALVGDGEDVISALAAGGWDFTEAITADSITRMVGAAVARKSMRTAPVSALYLFGRKQDIALQRGRDTISQRNHMRLWLAPFLCQGRPVWIGQVSRDIGVKFTRKSPTFTTHVIDPNVDESRQYVLQSLLHHEAVQWFAIARGVGAAARDDPRKNLTDDAYFTDGMRMVIAVSSMPVPTWKVVDLNWNDSTDPIREAKGEDSVIHKDRP